ncbi:3'-5' exonuclease [Elizabethkingia anophelis]|uniref:3'-5' exonuclease n=1 Tax=Elizabethkingia anophelis TaxID=1117645 RepID=UPI0038916EFC
MLLGRKLEQRPWGIELPKDIIYAKNLYISGDIKKAIKEIRTISIELIYGGTIDYHSLKEIEKEKSVDPYFNSLMIALLDELPDFSKTIEDWTRETQLFLKNKLDLNYEVDFNLRNRKSKYLEKSTLLESVSQHFKKSFSAFNIPITTIHQVKGQTLDSILVFFNERKHKDNITFENISNLENVFPDETRRLIYVALSRPKYLLAMAFPNTISDAKIYEKFGSNIKIISDLL